MRIPSLRCFLALMPLGVLAGCDGARHPAQGLAQAAKPHGQDSQAAAASVHETALGDHSVVIASHLYSTYDPGRLPSRQPRLVWPEALEAFGAELVRIDPRQVFMLGDNTRNARDEEWELLERVFAPLGERVQFAAGNHDQQHLEAFAKHGGVHRGVKLVGRNKYIQLDCVKVIDAATLEFLRRELADAEAYEHVFLLMHYFLAGWDATPEGSSEPLEPEAGADPNSMARVSNWQRDVEPLIAGKVDLVFVGDYRKNHLQTLVRESAGQPIRYVLNSFGFGHDQEVGAGSDGPMIFLELRFEGQNFSILPRAVPLDVRHGSYGFSPATQLRPLMLDWAQLDYGDPQAGVALQLAESWKVSRGESAELSAWVSDPSSAGRLEFSVTSFPLGSSEQIDRERALAGWSAALLAGPGGFELGEQRARAIGGQLGQWLQARGVLEGREIARWSQIVMHRGRAWAFTLSVPARLEGEYVLLWNFLISRVELSF